MGNGASDVQREGKRAEPFQPGEEQAQGDLNTVHKYLVGGIKNDEFFQWCPGQDRQRAQTQIWTILFKCKKKGVFLL